MKKAILAIIITLVVSTAAMAESSGALYRSTSSAVVSTSRCIVYAIFFHSDGTNSGTFNVYNSGTTSPSDLRQGPWVVGPADPNQGWTCPVGALFKNGLYITVSGTGAWFEVIYQGGGGS